MVLVLVVAVDLAVIRSLGQETPRDSLPAFLRMFGAVFLFLLTPMIVIGAWEKHFSRD